MTGELNGKIALVTGAGGGIGRASALALSGAGATVMVSDIDEAAARKVAEEIGANGGTADWMTADVTDAVQLDALHERIVERFGGLDIAHNNAGRSKGAEALVEQTSEDWDWTVAISLKSTFMAIQRQVPLMQARGGGAIVNTSSMAGVRNSNANASAAYASAKAGVIRLTQFAAAQHARDGIRVNAVSPGLVKTAAVDAHFSTEKQSEIAGMLHLIPRIIEPAEVAAAVLFLCSPGAAMITGHNIPVDGGMSVK